jgi:DEAD/DEAH box helicase domain-containing protein
MAGGASLNLVFFDLETQNLLKEVGGRERIDHLRMSCGVTFAALRSDFTVYWEKDVGTLLAELQSADLIIGFNLIGFDYKVLRPYAPNLNFASLRTLDMLLDIHRRLGFRLSLDAIASATLGTTKLADGIQAVEWFRAGELEDLVEYCKQDVEITRQIFEFGRTNGFVHYRSKLGSKLKVEVDWR